MTTRAYRTVALAGAAAAAAVLWVTLLAPGADGPAKAKDARIRAGDLLFLDSTGTHPDQPLKGIHPVGPDGTVRLGPAYGGRVKVADLTTKEAADQLRDYLVKTVGFKEPAVRVAWYDPDVHGEPDLGFQVAKLVKEVAGLRAAVEKVRPAAPAAPGADAPTPAKDDAAARIRAGDRLFVRLENPIPGSPLVGIGAVEPGGAVQLGASYGGRVRVANLTPEEAEAKLRDHLAKVGIKEPKVSVTWYDPVAHEDAGPGGRVAVPGRADAPAGDAPPQIRAGDRLVLESTNTVPGEPIKGAYAVEPAGTIPLGVAYGGRFKVAGLTPEEVEGKLRDHLAKVVGIKGARVTVTLYDPGAQGEADLRARVAQLEKEVAELRGAAGKSRR